MNRRAGEDSAPGGAVRLHVYDIVKTESAEVNNLLQACQALPRCRHDAAAPHANESGPPAARRLRPR